MKTELKAKFLQHLLSKKKANEGFTLVELLVVVIIIGILAAIALPSMLNQASKARLAGAQTQAGAINRAQQAYRLEAPTFASSTTELKIGTLSNPTGYTVAFGTGTATIGSVGFTAADTATDKSVSGCATATTDGITSSTVMVTTNPSGTPPTCT
ncbi:type IV pilin-like G/H family protein [Synechococcus sp. PCC 6312]|uniref:type IV pilin-like G/H family protein n=1 Tax=Synechococcus sp. (strain ATCC 27167 / PCC 6312) TaxID=195253 RepID=UPI00029F2B4F|nr:type IV pilin-like G/H family protein [Synechococcus sp. PCC 6312]AFY61568.1 prepilin-type N-terminal cleavage/methylation domain-containing protein [Synechococcus sp. PCC 6312]